MNRIKQLRKSKHITMEQLALSIGVRKPTVSRWENEKILPTLENWQALADFFDVSISYLQGKILFVDLSEDEQRIFTDVLDVLITTTNNKAIHVLEALLNSFKECYFEENTRIAPEKNRKGNN